MAAPQLIESMAPLYSFGELLEGEIVEHTFQAQNLSSPVTLVPGRSSCGCAISSLSTRSLGPRETVQITVRLDSSRMTGKVRAVVRLLAKAQERSQELPLTLEGTVHPAVVVSPDPIHFGEVALGGSPSLFLDIAPAQNSNGKISRVEVNDKRLTISPVKNGDTNRYQAHLTLHPSDHQDDIEAPLLIAFEGREDEPLVRYVRARVRGDLLAPQNIYLQRLGDKFEPRDIPVTSRTGRFTRLVQATDPLGFLDITIVHPRTPHALLRVKVRDQRRTYEPPANGTIEVKTGDPRQPALTIFYVLGEDTRR
jgi:hypothetical protein